MNDTYAENKIKYLLLMGYPLVLSTLFDVYTNFHNTTILMTYFCTVNFLRILK